VAVAVATATAIERRYASGSGHAPAASSRWHWCDRMVRCVCPSRSGLRAPEVTSTSGRCPGVRGHSGVAVPRIAAPPASSQEARPKDVDIPGTENDAEVVHAADSPEGHDKDRDNEYVAHQHPQQVARVGGDERVEVGPTKNRRQRNQHDRCVDGGHQHDEGRVRERDQLVAIRCLRIRRHDRSARATAVRTAACGRLRKARVTQRAGLPTILHARISRDP